MKMMFAGISTLLLTAVCVPSIDTRLANPEAVSAPRSAPGGRIVLAQSEVQIPSDAQLERMEERAITTAPLDVRGAPGRGLSEGAEIRQMDERARRIDGQLLGGGGIPIANEVPLRFAFACTSATAFGPRGPASA